MHTSLVKADIVEVKKAPKVQKVKAYSYKLDQEDKSDISSKTSRAFDVLIHSGKPNSVG